MWVATFEDGTSVSSEKTYWTDLPKDKKIAKLQIPGIPKEGEVEVLELSGADSYYYAVEAIALLSAGDSNSSIEAEIIGALNLDSNTLTEIRINYRTNQVETLMRPLSEYRYSKDILVLGKR